MNRKIVLNAQGFTRERPMTTECQERPCLFVTAAIICKDRRVLLCQRPVGKDCELLWEFPGGKIEPGERPEDCVIRECREELNVTLKVLRKYAEVEYTYPDRTVILVFFVCEIMDGKLECREHAALAWATLEELSEYTFCPADEKMLRERGMEAAFL